MNSENLTDLDELIQTVREKTSRSYISEAVIAYRSGAYRSAIVSTWIALTFDIILKLREISNKGDGQARNIIQDLEKYQTSKNWKKLWEIENYLLDDAYKKFEFINDSEYEFLKRLKKDRNRCAHPDYIFKDVLFQPTPELVRMHIVHAIKFLLMHQPVQGRYAIEGILQDIKRASFPSNFERAYSTLCEDYFDYAKDILIKDLIKVLLNKLLKMDDKEFLGKELNILNTLKSIAKRHETIYKDIMKEKLDEKARNLGDDQLISIFRLISQDGRCWSWLDTNVKNRLEESLKQFLEKMKSHDETIPGILVNNEIFGVVSIKALKDIIEELFNLLDPRNQEIVISRCALPPNRTFIDKAVELYNESKSIEDSENIGKNVILHIGPYFSPNNIKKMLKIAIDNYFIFDASNTPLILERLFEDNKEKLEKTKEYWQIYINALSFAYERLPKKENLAESKYKELIDKLAFFEINIQN